jgi:hypothetical protein
LRFGCYVGTQAPPVVSSFAPAPSAPTAAPFAGGAMYQMANCNLPILVIDSYGSEIPDEPRIMGRMQIFDSIPRRALTI